MTDFSIHGLTLDAIVLNKEPMQFRCEGRVA